MPFYPPASGGGIYGIEDKTKTVMVMDKDEAVKNNRLALLYAIDALVNKVADFSKIVL